MERTQTSTVLELTKSCMDKSKQLLSLHAEHSKYLESLGSKITDFKVWAYGVGALSAREQPKASLGPLDHKLMGRVDDLALVKNFLIILSDSLDYLISLPSNDPGVDRGTQNLDSALRNLARISIAIRRLGKASRARRADKSFKPEEYQELRNHLQCVILLRPSEDGQFGEIAEGKYLPTLDYSKLSDLQMRLIEANLRRRHSCLLAQKAQKHHSQEVPQTQLSLALPPPLNVTTRSQNLTSVEPPVHVREAPILPPRDHKTGQPTISTAEGSFKIPSLDEHYAPGVAKTVITWTAFDPKFPRPPRNPPDRNIPRCPCCCQFLPAEIFNNPKLWMQHLTEDVCPYTCIAENCPTPQLLFTTLSELQKHVEQTHPPRWECPFCEVKHAHHPTVESMEDHLKKDHREKLRHNSLPTLLSWCTVYKTGLTACPLCSSSGPEDSPELIDHVLHHTYEFALRALPWPPSTFLDVNVPPGSFRLPGKEHLQRWFDNVDAFPPTEEPRELSLCQYDKNDHSDPTPAKLSEYSDFFVENSYFDENSEDNTTQIEFSNNDQSSDTTDLVTMDSPQDAEICYDALFAEPSGDLSFKMYRYEALPSGEDYIRRLILEPGEDDAPLVGRLETIKLRSAADLHPFRAISYAWGPANKYQIITVNGNRLKITTSLRDSLLQARDAHSSVGLWADGICINQDDDEEKSRQVALMGRIYETSRCTLICLGLGLDIEDRQHASDVVGLIAEVETLIREVFEDPKFTWDWDSFPHPPADHALFRDYRWDSWGRLVQQPWFRRGWVVQEAALGPDALMLWAGEEVRLVRVLRVCSWMAQRAQSLIPTLKIWEIPMIHLDLYHIQHPEEARTFWRQKKQHHIKARPALEILHYARELLLSDPKDRIYAFMTLRTLDKAMPAVRPNYGKDVSHLDVYRDFAIKYLEETSDLDILRFVERGEEQNSLSIVAVADPRAPSVPSWVPRWDCVSPLSLMVDRAARKITCIEDEPNNTRGSPISIIEGRPVLRVRAITFGSVTYVSEPIEDPSDAPESAVTQVFSLWGSLVRQSNKFIEPHCGISGLAFLTLLTFGRFIGEWQDFSQSLLDLARRLQSHQPFHPTDAHSQDPAVQEISLWAGEQSKDRRVILIDRGYYGIAPNITLEGDLCTIIHGTRTPFILRRVPGKQDQYSVVGPAFVLSNQIRKDNGFPYRLAEEDFCDDWKDWDLQSEEIILV